jgi:HTH-type transcriptional regulator, transcriptional repressor of NAD biosynthesis genes
MKEKKVGLILGKIAPYHKAHSFLINTALKVVDELIFVVYDCPDRIHISTNIRADWVRKQYPQVNVIEGWDAPNEHDDSDVDIQKKQEKYISQILNGKKVTHFISSEKYGEHMSKHLKAENIVVDMERKKNKISSTMIRMGGVYKNRKYLPSLVYYDLITKVALVGFDLESTNKLTKKIASKYKTIFDPLLNEPYNKKNLLNLIEKKKTELYDKDSIKKAKTFAFYNKTLIEGYVFLQGTKREFSLDIREEALRQIRSFDIIFLNQTEDKIVNGVNSSFLNNQLVALLDSNKIKHFMLTGNEKEKQQKIGKILDLNLKNKKFL